MSFFRRHFHAALSVLAVGLLSCFAVGALSAQNLKDDITNNDLEGLKSKVALLEPDFKAFPYLAHYLSTTKDYQQPLMDYLLDQGASVDQPDERGVGPLYYAITKGNLGAVQTLIARKANVNAGWKLKATDIAYPTFFLSNSNAFSEQYQTFVIGGKNVAQSEVVSLLPLWLALKSDNVDMVPTLLAAGADPLGLLFKVKDEKASTSKKAVYLTNSLFDQVVGHFSVSGNGLDRVSPVLFANGFHIWQSVRALPKAKQPVVDPALAANLFAYFSTGDMKAFKAELVRTGANTLAFLPYAALAENWDIVNLILQYNQLEIDDAWDNSKQSLLGWALANFHTSAARMLISHEAAIPAKVRYEDNRYGDNRNDEAPLARAVWNGKTELVALLLENKVDPDESFALSYANRSPVIRKMLIDAGAKTDLVLEYHDNNSGGKISGSYLFHAADEAIPEAVSFWLAQGIAPDADSIVAAALRGSPECVRLLIGKGADVAVTLTKEERYFFDIYYDDFSNNPIRDYIAHRAENARDPLEKNRFNNIVKQIDKAMAKQ